MVAVFTKCGKTGFAYYRNFLDQNGRSKENFLDLKCGRRGVLELEGDLMQWKEVCFAGEMSNKQLLQQVYTYLRSNKGGNYENY